MSNKITVAHPPISDKNETPPASIVKNEPQNLSQVLNGID